MILGPIEGFETSYRYLIGIDGAYMRIGIDFDNTIVSYDALFHKLACEQGLIPSKIPTNKVAVREYLVRTDREANWTLMQGLVYGDRMDEASIYDGVVNFFHWAREKGHQMAIISHKTRHPFKGPKYDLHKAAKGWIEHHLVDGGEPLIQPSQIFFELTKEEKFSRIAAFKCDVFIDDLLEILLSEHFPAGTKRVLFDPDEHHVGAINCEFHIVSTWMQIIDHLEPK